MTTELEERRVEVAELEIGMFVCRLDRPWEESPFLLQGVELFEQEDLEQVRALCEYVFIDARRELVDGAKTLTRKNLADERFSAGIKYADQVDLQTELPAAREALRNATAIVDTIFADVASGQDLSAEHVEQAVRPLVASVLRSADAIFWIDGLRDHDSYTYRHAIGCSALAAAFGRHMGFAEETIISLAAGALLMDLGKSKVPEEMLQQPAPLAEGQIDVMRRHVQHGVELVERSGITDPDVLDIVSGHHERYDGSGYPNGVFGGGLSIVVRMMGIVDAYHAMISPRPYRAAVPRHKALREIYAARDELFQTEMVEQFQVCLGVYPTGSLVELDTGEIAVVMSQNQVRRLRPRVVVISTPDKQPAEDFRVIDLLDLDGAAQEINIVRSLAEGDFDFDATNLFLG